MKNSKVYIILFFIVLIIAIFSGRIVGYIEAKIAFNNIVNQKIDYKIVELTEADKALREINNKEKGYKIFIPEKYEENVSQIDERMYIQEFIGEDKKIQIRVTDIYEIYASHHNEPREKFSFDNFSDYEIIVFKNNAFKTFLNSEGVKEIDKKDIEESIIKLGNSKIITIKYTMLIKNEEINRIEYLTLKRGIIYSIIGYYKNDPNEIYRSLNSIQII